MSAESIESYVGKSVILFFGRYWVVFFSLLFFMGRVRIVDSAPGVSGHTAVMRTADRTGLRMSSV